MKDWFKHYVLCESNKEIELNRILDKVSINDKLNANETNYLNTYHSTDENDIKDYTHLSRNMTCDKIAHYLDKTKKIYCDIYDKDGKINELILKIEKPCFKLTLKHGFYTLHEKYLYNIKYNLKKDEYSLTCQDEYFEEIKIEK